ncbi:MAG TPA: tetratricopeptide repeat protein [Thiobacillus sp.]
MRHMLLHTPLRCRECRHRFWVFNPLKPLLLLASVGVLIAVTAWFALDQHADRPGAQVDTSLPHVRAARGDADAQLQLGMRYAEGDGVIKDDKEAAKWFALAAKQGLAEAQYQYGLALLQGRGVVQDYHAAFTWIEKPAQRGYARAQYSLGELYRYGTGTAVDKARAYLWFNLAAAQGVEMAAKVRDSLAWQLKPEQIAAMQDEARRMSPGAAPAAIPAAAAPAAAAP